MRERPCVSVVVPTRDRAAMLREALESIERIRGDDFDLDVLVIDDGTQESTRDVASGFGAKYLRSGGRGTAAARNEGMRNASGDFIAFLDDDDAWTTGHLRPHLRLLDRYPALAGAVGQVVEADSQLRPRSDPWPEVRPADGRLFTSFLRVTPQIGATVVRTSVRETVGFMDERLVHLQDVDWHLRLAMRHRVGFVRVPSVLFRSHRDPISAEDLMWARYGVMHRVYLRNIVRARGRMGATPWAVAGAYRAQMAWLHSTLADCAARHLTAHERMAARRSMARAVVGGPASALKAAATRSSYRHLLFHALTAHGGRV